MSETSVSPVSTPVDPLESAYAALDEFLDRLACLGKAQAIDSLAANEFTISQMKLLFILGAHDQAMSVNEIAEGVRLSLAAAGRTVDKLVVGGFVDRREDPADRRVKRVSLTDKGESFVQSQHDIKKEIVRRFVTGLPGSVRDDLGAALRRIVESEVDYFDISPLDADPDK